MTNCVNCGAPLHGTKCEYCGTEYTEVNLEHRWYRVAWKPEYDREQHECFKF